MKKYLNIKEVSKLLDLKEHVIRYWDSIDPKTNKLRVDGISTKSKGGTRYFSNENLIKLKNLKSIIYENGDHNSSHKLANIILSNRKYQKSSNVLEKSVNFDGNEKIEKIDMILI